jgi:chromosome segregation ATPase
MVEPMMYFGIGFLVAALFALLFIPLVHHRAVRLTMRRMEAATPLSVSEIRADKDQLRAEFAMSARRLELSVDQLRTKTTAQLAELGKKTDAINQLKKELGEKAAACSALEARDKALSQQLRSTEEEFKLKGEALREAERALADKEAALAKLTADLGDHSASADNQRLELAALRTQVEAMKVSVADYERTTKETEERLARERAHAAAATSELTEARGKLEGLSARTAELERRLFAQSAAAEHLNERIQDLEARLGDQARLLAEREHEIERLRGEAESARKIESDLRAEAAVSGDRTRSVLDRHKADIATLEARLATAIDERAQLEKQVATMTREAEAAWASERVENAMLRERINDVAAEVAHLTAALEGPDSPIEAILAAATPGAGHANGNGASAKNGKRGAKTGRAGIETAQEPKSTLADRIRALQSSASRAARSN